MVAKKTATKKIATAVDPTMELLKTICKETNEHGKSYVGPDSKPLMDSAMIEVDPSDNTDDGRIAAVATDLGFETANIKRKAAIENKPVQKMIFEIENVELPTKKGGGRTGESIYPFELLEVGQSFHIAATDENPDPGKKVASSMSSYNAKFKTVVGVDEEGKEIVEYSKKLSCRAVGDEDPKGPGCRVGRIL